MKIRIFLVLLLLYEARTERTYKLITSRLHPNDVLNGEVGEENADIEDTFDKLMSRYGEKFRQRIGARMLREKSQSEINEICGTSSSLECGNAVVTTFGTAPLNTFKRCQARKDFLECIDTQRKKCKELSENGFYPILPPKHQIRSIQENAWKTLWTSGGCVLEV